MHLSLVKKNFLNLYVRLQDDLGNNSIECVPIGEINSEACDNSKISAITQALLPCLCDYTSYNSHKKVLDILAVKNVEGYKIAYVHDPIPPYIEDFNCGWVGTGNGVWTYEKPTKSFSDIYSLQAGIQYWLTLGDTVGTRFRVMFSTVDISSVSSGTVTGVAVNTSNYNNPAPNQSLYYTPDHDGYLIVQKDNVGSSGIKTYLYYAKDLS